MLLNAAPHPQLHIIDFEFAHFGHRATDLGQMIGDLLEKSYMFDSGISTRSNCEMMIEAFIKGYGAVTESTAYRVITHAGVHVINWCTRHPDAETGGKVEEMMRMAVEVIVRAWGQEQAGFDGGVLGCLFVETSSVISVRTS